MAPTCVKQATEDTRTPTAEAAPSHLILVFFVSFVSYARLGMTELIEAKRALRLEAAALRASAHEAQNDAAAVAAARFLDAVPPPSGACVSGYWTAGSELDDRLLLAQLHGRGHEIGLPVVAAKGRPLVFRRWRPDESLVPGVLGIPTPRADAPEIEPDVLIVPLLAFDRAGYRLGYGGGYYDRTLAALRAVRPVVAVGFAFAAQEIANVPHGPEDQRLDWIVTERAARRASAEFRV